LPHELHYRFLDDAAASLHHVQGRGGPALAIGMSQAHGRVDTKC
jgi:hypothetical protein